jgi:hypothetical protein
MKGIAKYEKAVTLTNGSLQTSFSRNLVANPSDLAQPKPKPFAP